MSLRGQDSSRSEPYRVGFPHEQQPPKLNKKEFPLLDRILALTPKIKRIAGEQGWMTVLNAVRKSEAEGKGFEGLPRKVQKLIEEAESS
jgi:hypothetical protein